MRVIGDLFPVVKCLCMGGYLETTELTLRIQINTCFGEVTKQLGIVQKSTTLKAMIP